MAQIKKDQVGIEPLSVILASSHGSLTFFHSIIQPTHLNIPTDEKLIFPFTAMTSLPS